MEAEEESKFNELSDQNLQVNSEQIVKENPPQQKLSDNNCLAQFSNEESVEVPLIVKPTENSEGNNKNNNFLSQEGSDKILNKSSKDTTLSDLTNNVNISNDTDNNYADCSRRNSSQDNEDNKQINILSSINADLKQLGLDGVKPTSNLTAVNDLSPRSLNKKNDASKLTLHRSQSLTFNYKRNSNSSDDTSDYFKTTKESRLRKVFSADSQPKLTTDFEKANYVKGNGSCLQKLTIKNKNISNSELNNFCEQSQIKNINSNKGDSELKERISLKLSVDNENQNLIKCNNLTPQEPVSYRLVPLLNSQHFEEDNSVSKKKSAEKTFKKLEDKLQNSESSLTRLHRNCESRKISDGRTANLEKICKLPSLKSSSYHDIDCGKITTNRPLILPPLGISTNENVLKQYLKRKKNWSPSAESDTTFKVPVSTKLKSTSALPLIKTSDARSRNYLLGNLGKDRALLGLVELERYFPLHKVQIFVGTWNVNNTLVTEPLDDFLLPKDVEYIPDIYVIGTQEASSNKQEWEIRMQETLGSSHVLFHSVIFGTLHLAVFMRRDLVWMCSVPEVFSINTRIGKKFKTKGAVAMCFQFFGTSFLFITSHFTAHDEKLKERILDFEKVVTSIDLPKILPLKGAHNSADSTLNFDCVFWCGDLNFRINQERPAVISLINSINSQRSPNFEDLLREDQLRKTMNEGKVFRGFSEARINFMPTYKYNIGTNEFDSSVKLRIPSYTDRILYRSKKKNSISCILYNSAHNLKSSDHKPVYCCFEVQIQPGRDNVPLAAGLFNREVYLEALKRRANSMDLLAKQKDTTVLSNVCSIM